jgi:FKBP-type peptidyl-prolyl cis-trans isomerase FkpA/FKBP-type peptidyl-prolyl cis-trans isomerase FklB
MRAFGKIAVALSLLLAVPAAAVEPELKTEEQKTVYALGLSIAQSLGSFALTPAEVELVAAGIRDGLANSPKVDAGQYNAKVKELAQQRASAVSEIEKKESVSFLEKIGKEKGAEKTASGLIYIPVQAGSGAAPKATDTVKVHYKGTLRDGSVFDSSVERGQPASFPLNRVVPCWTEGLQKMQVGGKAKLACPSNLAYGDRGAPPKIKPGAALLFEVELLSIEPPAATPAGAPAAKPGTPAGHP